MEEGGNRGDPPPSGIPANEELPLISFVSDTGPAAEEGRNSPPPLIEFADAPAPANVIVGLGEGVGGAMQREGEEKYIPPLIPELSALKVAPILTNEMINLGEETSGAKQGEG